MSNGAAIGPHPYRSDGRGRTLRLVDQAEKVRTPASWVVVGLDNGGTCNNATVLDATGRFLVDHLVENPSLVLDGPESAVEQLAEAFTGILAMTSTPLTLVRAVGLDTPGPASATGVISSKGATNFSQVSWHGFDIRGALEARLGLQVIYNNDANAAALYAHHRHFGEAAMTRSSVSAVVGTGLGGGVVENGRVISGAAGMAGELGHVQIPLHGVLEPDQPVPACNCGFEGDVESIASLTGIKNNLLPYWLGRFPDHPLASEPIGKLFTIAANFTDPAAYFLGGGVVEAAPHFRQWFLNTVREHTQLRQEQMAVASFALVADLDMAGARGAAVAALEAVQSG